MAELQKREKIMAGVAGGFLVAFLLYQFVFTKSGEPQPPGKQKAPPKAQPAVVQKSLENIMPEKARREASYANFEVKTWGRDPFAEAYRLAVFDTSAIDSSMRVALKGIIWKGHNAYVLINDSILRKGDKIGDIQIVEIRKDRAICKRGNDLITLYLDGEK